MISYYHSPEVDISIFAHDGIRPFKPRHDKEFLLVRNAWYPSKVKHATRRFRKSMGKPNDRIIFLSATKELHKERLKHQFNSHYINNGAFIDKGIFRPSTQEREKIYDAVAVSRFTWHKRDEMKRHYLMSEILSLALLDPVLGSTDEKLKKKYTQQDNCKFYNNERLQPAQVNRIFQQSHCGLILSSQEGICRASSEYLLAGLPVVSTKSVGGRDVWYDDYNSIIVEPCSLQVKEAVNYFKTHPRDPFAIREEYLEKARVFRQRFITDVIEPILGGYPGSIDCEEFLEKYPFQWWPQESGDRDLGGQ